MPEAAIRRRENSAPIWTKTRKRYALLLLLLGSILASGASCPPNSPPGATLTARTDRSQTDVTLHVQGHGYTPGQTVTISIQNVPGKADGGSGIVPDPAGNFHYQNSYGLTTVPRDTELANVVVVGRDATGWSLIATTSANPFVILFP